MPREHRAAPCRVAGLQSSKENQLAVEAIVSAYDWRRRKMHGRAVEGSSVIARETLEIGSIPSRLPSPPGDEVQGDRQARILLACDRAAYPSFPAYLSGRKEPLPQIMRPRFSVGRHRCHAEDPGGRRTSRAGEHRYLTRLFEARQKVQFDEVLFQPTANARGAQGRTRLPQDVDGWAQYRLAILGDLSPSELDSKKPASAQRVCRRSRRNPGADCRPPIDASGLRRNAAG